MSSLYNTSSSGLLCPEIEDTPAPQMKEIHPLIWTISVLTILTNTLLIFILLANRKLLKQVLDTKYMTEECADTIFTEAEPLHCLLSNSRLMCRLYHPVQCLQDKSCHTLCRDVHKEVDLFVHHLLGHCVCMYL